MCFHQLSRQSPPQLAVQPLARLVMVSLSLCLKFVFCVQNLSVSTLWHHVNTVHICRGTFPPLSFFTLHKRLLCYLPSCCWETHSRFKHSGCTRPTDHFQHCHAPLVDPSQVPLVPSCYSPAVISEAVISSENV